MGSGYLRSFRAASGSDFSVGEEEGGVSEEELTHVSVRTGDDRVPAGYSAERALGGS